MRLALSFAQAAQIAPHLRPGFALLGRITREGFDGTNPQSSGRLTIELGNVPTASLPALRDAIRKATAPAPKRKAKARACPNQTPARSTATLPAKAENPPK